jgi:hypothetical protein
MRSALIRSIKVAILALALSAPGQAAANPARPVVRLVFVGGADPPSWFDGFAKHLQSELALRGIDVAVAREGGPRAPGESSAAAAEVDAELVVDAPSALRPVLRFSVAKGAGGAHDTGSAPHVRQVNLSSVPRDGCALALAVAADELMRSNWSRAVPAERADAGAGEGEPPPHASEQRQEGNADAAAREGEKAAPASESGDRATTVDADMRGEAAAASTIGAAAAVETFTAGQTQIGADVRGTVRLVPRLELELRGGWRSIVARETTHGSIDGHAIVFGGALALRVVESARVGLLIVGRADVLRASYSGQTRDAASVDATTEAAYGCVLGVGPRGRVLLTRSLALDAEVLAGVSPIATTAADAGSAVVSTNGAALMASLGLSFGL